MKALCAAQVDCTVCYRQVIVELASKPELQLGWAGHGGEKLRVVLGLGEAAQQEFHSFHSREGTQNFAQHPNSIQLIRWQKQFVFARSGAVDIDSREYALIDQATVKVDFH